MPDINLNALSQFISGGGAYAGFGGGGLGRSRWQSTRQDAYQAQLLYESDSYAGELVQNVVKFAIGGGLVVDFNNEFVQAFWDQWPWNISSRLSRPSELQSLATTSLIRDGDIFGRTRPDQDGEAWPVLDILEARYIGGIGTGRGSSQAGVKLDRQGRPVGYLYRPRLGSWDGGVAGGSDLLRDQTEIPAEQVIHAFRLEYGQQVRGLSWIRRAIWPLLALRAFDVILERAAELAILDRGYWTIAMDLLEDMTDTVDELDDDEDAGTATADTRAALIKEFLTRTDWDNVDKQKRLPEGMKWEPQQSAGITDSRMVEGWRAQLLDRATAGLGVSQQAITDPSSRTFPVSRVDLMKDYRFYELVPELRDPVDEGSDQLVGRGDGQDQPVLRRRVRRCVDRRVAVPIPGHAEGRPGPARAERPGRGLAPVHHPRPGPASRGRAGGDPGVERVARRGDR